MQPTYDGSLLKAMRKERGFNQVEVSKMSGIPQPTISNYENGTEPGPKALYSLGKVFGLDVGRMFEILWQVETNAA